MIIKNVGSWNSLALALKRFWIKKHLLQLSVAMMSWDRVWVDLRLFTTQFSDKVLLETWKLREWELKKFWEGFGYFLLIR